MAAYGLGSMLDHDVSSRCLLAGMKLDIPHDESLRCPPDAVVMGTMGNEADRHRRHTAKVSGSSRKIVAFADLNKGGKKKPE